MEPHSSCLKRVHSDEASELDSSASEECSSSGNAAESDTGFEPGPSADWSDVERGWTEGGQLPGSFNAIEEATLPEAIVDSDNDRMACSCLEGEGAGGGCGKRRSRFGLTFFGTWLVPGVWSTRTTLF